MANQQFNKKSFFVAVMLFATLGLVATDIYLPSFPAIAEQFSTTNTYVQLTFSIYLFAFSISQVFYGPYSEKHGRKKTVMIGIGFSLIGTVVCMLSPNIETLLVGRTLQGLGLGVSPSIFRAILRDAFTGNKLAHAASLVAVSSACMMALAPMAGGYIQSYLGWRYNFAFVLLYSILIGLLIWTCLPETLPEKNHHATKLKVMVKNYYTLLTSPIFMGYALCGGLSFAGLTAYLTVSPFIFQEVIGLSPVEYGWLALVVAAGVGIGGFLNGLFVKKVGLHRMLLIGIILSLVGGISMALLGIGFINTLVVIIPTFIFITGGGISFGNCNAGALHHFPNLAGFAGSLYGTLQVFGSALVTSLMAVLPEKNQIPLSIVLISVGISALILQHIAYTYHKKTKEEH